MMDYLELYFKIMLVVIPIWMARGLRTYSINKSMHPERKYPFDDFLKGFARIMGKGLAFIIIIVLYRTIPRFI